MPQTAPNSSFRGFVLPGTGSPFSFDTPQLGFDEGYLVEAPLAGQSLDSFMQQVVAGITGLPGNLVIPRWQPEPPNLLASQMANPATPSSINWAAVGVTDSRPLGFPADVEVSSPSTSPVAASGFSRQNDQEEFDCLVSFYGPLADNLAVMLRSGIMVAQNRECLQFLAIGLINTSGRRRVPTLTQLQWLMRVDITLTFRRAVRVNYPVLYFLSSPVSISTDTGLATPADAT